MIPAPCYCLNIQYSRYQGEIRHRRKHLDGLTPRQADILSYLIDRCDEEGICPSREDIRHHFGFRSPNSVTAHLKALRRKGLISWKANKARTIRVAAMQVDRKHASTSERIPILGQIAAGEPILAAGNFEDSLEIPAGFLGQGIHFAVNVKGDSMRDAGIDNGDLAVLRHEVVPISGAIMAVVIDDEAVLKRVFHGESILVLRSENPAFTDIVLGPSVDDSVRIAGKLVALLKRFE